MIPVLRKVAQLNIKYKKMGAPPDEATALRRRLVYQAHLQL